ncbi:MAG TPA: DUF3037 domain-containing protein [Abditibacteriaceae bacterium]|jgi:hypothetical protein
MPELFSFDYAVIRIVPRVEREEFLNAGIVLYGATQRFLQAQVEVDKARLAAFAPWMEIEEIEEHLAAIPLICKGGKESGPVGLMEQRARFHWLVAPRSTIVQTSPAHSGMAHNLNEALEHLMNCMVRLPESK